MDNNKPYTKFRKTDQSPLLYGKVPPQAPDLEVAILGALMIEPSSLYVVFPIIPINDIFYSDANQRIYAAIRRLYDKGTKIDFMTVCEELRKQSELEMVGGSYYVTKLTQDMTSSAHIEEHCRLVVQKYILREVIRIGGSAVGDAYENSMDCLDLIRRVEDDFIELNYTITSGRDKSLTTIMSEVMDSIFKPKKGYVKIKFGIRDLDNAFGGSLQTETLGLVVARPAVGKTSFLIEEVLLQSNDYPVGVWNGELSEDRLMKRFISNRGKIGYSYLKQKEEGETLPEYIENKIQETNAEILTNNKIHINNTQDILISDLIAIIRYWVHVKGVKVVWLDYLKYITLPDTPKFNHMPLERQLEYICKQLLRCSKECKIPIILLHQLNRESLKATDKTPHLGNLGGSDAIGQIASWVLALHRPEEFNIKEDEQGRSTDNITEVIILKNSDGKGNVKVRLVNQKEYFSMKEEYYEPLLKTEIANDLPF